MKKLAILGLAGLLTGCATYKHPVKDFNSSQGDIKLQEKASEHDLYNFIPRHRQQLEFYDIRWLTWSLFGNDDDGLFGEIAQPPYSPDINYGTAGKWLLRNPGHNFTFYTIGSAHWKKHNHFSLIGFDANGLELLEKQEPKVFGSGKMGLNVALNDYKPFFSFHFPVSKKREFQFYVGWRERGNFGFKLRPGAKRQD